MYTIIDTNDTYNYDDNIDKNMFSYLGNLSIYGSINSQSSFAISTDNSSGFFPITPNSYKYNYDSHIFNTHIQNLSLQNDLFYKKLNTLKNKIHLYQNLTNYINIHNYSFIIFIISKKIIDNTINTLLQDINEINYNIVNIQKKITYFKLLKNIFYIF